jgi:hypothetical protein
MSHRRYGPPRYYTRGASAVDMLPFRPCVPQCPPPPPSGPYCPPPSWYNAATGQCQTYNAPPPSTGSFDPVEPTAGLVRVDPKPCFSVLIPGKQRADGTRGPDLGGTVCPGRNMWGEYY